MKKKNLIAAGMTAVMTVGLLAGCGGNSDSGESTTEDGKKKVSRSWRKRLSVTRQTMMM